MVFLGEKLLKCDVQLLVLRGSRAELIRQVRPPTRLTSTSILRCPTMVPYKNMHGSKLPDAEDPMCLR